MTGLAHGPRTTWLVGGAAALAVVAIAVVLLLRHAPAEEGSTVPSPSAAPTTAPPADGRTPTSVVVTFAEWSTASGAVEAAGLADVVESGGTCTLTLTQGAATVTTSITAEPDAASTSCGTLTVPRADLAPGRWTGVLRYASTASVGESASFTIEVPS